ncbi:MAG TPA: HAMP domain-containing protein [Ktedonobacteraceae bacterium]
MSLASNHPQKSQPLRSSRQIYGGRNLFLDLPIAWRLALGFLVAALVAALAAGVVGLERSQSLSKQTDFYHRLLQVNTSLTTGRSFLELMNSKLHQTVDDAGALNPSRETLALDNAALANLTNLYTQTLNTYVQQDLLEQHSDQMLFLNEANADNLAQQQLTLTSSTQRTWQYYQTAQQDTLAYLSNPTITPAQLKSAQLVLQQQAEPTNADALSALHSLLQLDDRLASAVDNATNVEIHNQLLTTLIATLCAFLFIALVGWFISETLVRRLRHLQRVTRAVEEGSISERVRVTGRDEIAEVSLAVNSMVDTIVTLLEETRQQRDALTGAAEHLFSDMRIANAGDLRINATVSNDPIGMLANAFNFTVGRFRRFVLRTQATVDQLEVVSRQSLERSGMFIALVRMYLRDMPHSQTSGQAPSTSPLPRPTSGLQTGQRKSAPLEPTQDALLQLTRGDLEKRLTTTSETIERATLSVGRLSELITRRTGTFAGSITEKTAQTQRQELGVLEQLLRKLSREIHQVQLNSTHNLARLDAALTSREVSAPDFAEVVPGITETQYLEFVRQAGSFAVEINALAKRLGAILQEMRTGIVPFHLEGASNPAEGARTANYQLEIEPFASLTPSNLTGRKNDRS